LDPAHVDFVQLLDKAENGVELRLERLRLVIADSNTREPGHPLYGRLVDGHRDLSPPSRNARPVRPIAEWLFTGQARPLPARVRPDRRPALISARDPTELDRSASDDRSSPARTMPDWRFSAPPGPGWPADDKSCCGPRYFATTHTPCGFSCLFGGQRHWLPDG